MDRASEPARKQRNEPALRRAPSRAGADLTGIGVRALQRALGNAGFARLIASRSRRVTPIAPQRRPTLHPDEDAASLDGAVELIPDAASALRTEASAELRSNPDPVPSRAVQRSIAARPAVAARPSAGLQRNWGSKELEAKDEETEWPARFQLMNGWSLDYMLETADELKKAGRLNKYIEQASIAANVKGIFGDRIIAALKTSAARYDPEWYTVMFAVKPHDPQGFDILLRRAGKAVNAARIDAALPQLADRFISRGDVEAAGLLLDPLPMSVLLEAVLIINATGHGDQLRGAGVHKDPARAKRIALASTLNDWIISPLSWASKEATVRADIASLPAADSMAIAVWVGNKPELAHLVDVGDMSFKGQFAFGQDLYGLIMAKLVGAHANTDPAIDKAMAAAADRDSPTFGEDVAAGAKAARAYSGIGSLFTPREVSKKRGLQIYEAIWAEFEKTRTTATMSKFVNLYDLHSLGIAEADRCNAQVRHMHSLHTNVGGKASGPAPPLAANALASRIIDHKMPAKYQPWRGSEVVYVGNLGAAVTSMKAVLDTKHRIIMGVLSGVTGGMTPEHYLYVIGYRGNSFICADSDPGNEQTGRMPISGITYLYYDAAANRLSTAPTDADFPINFRDGESRFQMNGPHRYQALSISVLP